MSAGRAIAGHIGAQARFEYTVIGDPVNEAARLTELAKLETGHVLASAIAVSGALDAEALCWDVGEIVELRGRAAPTQLARPVNLAAPGEAARSPMSTRSSSDVAALAWRTETRYACGGSTALTWADASQGLWMRAPAGCGSPGCAEAARPRA